MPRICKPLACVRELEQPRMVLLPLPTPTHLQHHPFMRLPGGLLGAGLAAADDDVGARAVTQMVRISAPHHRVHRAVALDQRGPQHAVA